MAPSTSPSHNPPEYNGIKFSTPDGVRAASVTKRIEAEIAASDAANVNDKPKPSAKSVSQQVLEPRAKYLYRLQEIVDFKAIKKANLRVVFDPFGEPPADIPTRCCATPAGCFHGPRLQGCPLRRSRPRTRRPFARRLPHRDASHQSQHRDSYRRRRRSLRNRGRRRHLLHSQLHRCFVV